MKQKSYTTKGLLVQAKELIQPLTPTTNRQYMLGAVGQLQFEVFKRQMEMNTMPKWSVIQWVHLPAGSNQKT